jgi:hypothetical protein
VGGLVLFYASGYFGNRGPRYSFDQNEWKRDSDGAFLLFHEDKNKCLFEVAGSKYNGAVHGTGYYRLEGDTMVYRLGDYWLDVGRGFGTKKIPTNLESALNLKREQKFKVVWVDSNTFKLTQNWWSSTGETWRRQFGNRRTDRWHYDPDHYIPSRWVDGRGWVPDKSEQKPATTSTPPLPSGPEFEASDFYRAFTDKPAESDRLYKNKTITLVGAVELASVNPMGQVFVLLKAGGSDYVTCMFPAAAKSTVTSLREGQNVKIRGECTGLMYGAFGLQNCTLVK